MTATLGSFPVFRALDANGAPLVGGLLYSFSAGTLTPLATYVDAAGVTTNANPVVLDSTGSANVWFGSSAYKLVLKTSTGSTLWTVDNYQPESAAATLRSDLASTASTSLGDGLVGVMSTALGAVSTTQHEVNQRTVNVMDFMTAAQKADILTGTPVIDCANAIQAAMDHAKTLSMTPWTNPGGGAQYFGGMTVVLPAGEILLATSTSKVTYANGTVTASIITYDNCRLVGQGVNATFLKSTADAPVIANAPQGYGTSGMGYKNFTIVGKSDNTSQVGILINRDWWGDYQDIVVTGCGSTGIWLRECINTHLIRVESMKNRFHGLIVDKFAAGIYPSLGCQFDNCNFSYNAYYGVFLDGMVGGCRFNGCTMQNNYNVWAAGDAHYQILDVGTTDFTLVGSANNTVGTQFVASGTWAGTGLASSYVTGKGYQVYCQATGYVPNEFTDCWFEGATNAYVYMNASGAILRLTRMHHIPGTNTNKAVINDLGIVHIDDAYGAANAYATVAGSNAPFQVKSSAAAYYRINGTSGCTLSYPGPWVCTEAGATTGLVGKIWLNNYTYHLGDQRNVTGNNGIDHTYYEEGDAYSRITINTVDKRIVAGAGTAAPVGPLSVKAGAVLTSAATIAPTEAIHHVSGTGVITTISLPYTNFVGSIVLIPDAAFTTTTAGNIYLASTGVVNKAMTMTYDGTKWSPSY